MGSQKAQMEAQKEGVIDLIHLCQRLLKVTGSTKVELASLSLDELKAMSLTLERQLGLPGE